MKAIQYTIHGGPEVLQIIERETPAPGPGEVRIKVSAAGVNFADTQQRKGTYPTDLGLPLTPGVEAAGTVDAVGDGADASLVGKRVAVSLPERGGYAEYVVAPVASVIPIPDGVSDTVALALWAQGLTAFYLLEGGAPPRSGASVLIHAAAGGVGQILVQLAKRNPNVAKVVATASTAEKLEAVRAMGADEAINYRDADWADQVTKATNGNGPDIILDSVGGAIGARSLDILAPNGRYVLYGLASGEWNPLDAGRMMQFLGKNQTVGGFSLYGYLAPENIARGLESLYALVQSSDLQIATQSYPLTEAAEAHRAMEARETSGKVVLTV